MPKLSSSHHFIRFAFLALTAATVALAQDPPSRIARLNYLSGSVSMQPAGLDDWTPAEFNRPFTTGDTLFTETESRAEFHLDTAVIRAGENTTLSFLTLNDQAVQLSLTEGDLYVNVRELEPAQTFEVDSPNSSISLLRPGLYRFRVTSGELTFAVVRQGQTEVTGGGQAFTLTPGNSASISGSTQLTYDIEPAPQPDDFDFWSQSRDAREATLASARYLPRSVVGYEDLDANGSWQNVPGYGPVWYPHTVVAGWAPYHYGHWAWIEPWGWTWVDDAPWGFAPFHYGRWAFITGHWGWSPGPIVILANRPAPPRPVYAPALVAWFGGAHFGISVSIGGGAPSLGWVSLGVGEVYTPSYHCSPRYFNNVNVSNTTIVKNVNITNVYNIVYVNKTVYNQRFVNVQAPNAVTAMPQAAFASGRSAGQAGASMAPRQVHDMQPETAGVMAPPVAPTRQALMAGNSAVHAARPSAAVMQRKVIVHSAPATSPAPFAQRQVYLQQHVGEAHDSATMHKQVVAQNPAPQVERVRVASPATMKPIAIKPIILQPEQPMQPKPQLIRPQTAPIQPAPIKPIAQPVQPKLETPKPSNAPVLAPHIAYPQREQKAKPSPHPEQPRAEPAHKEKPDEKKEKHP